MPVRLISKEFEDINGVITPSYVANAGDVIACKFVIGDITRVFSLNNSWTFNYTTETITWSGGNWLAEGFRLGDTISMTYFTSGGSGIYPPFSLVIAYISETEMQFTTSIPHQLQIDEYMEISSTNYNQELVVSYAHVINEVGGTDLSLIDGNKTSLSVDVSSMVVTDILSMTQIGHKSGSYFCDASIERLADVSGERRYEVLLTIINDGIILDGFYSGNDCLKLLVYFEFIHLIGETDNHSYLKFDELANTGWYNEAFNNSTPNSSITLGTSDIYYDAPTTFQVIVTDNNVRLGACYVPINDTYFKDKYFNQSELGMYASKDITLGVVSSYTNPNGASYSLDLSATSVVGLNRLMTVTLNPNASFKSFFEDSSKDQDRRLIIWAQSGNVNWIVFDGQMTEKPKGINPLLTEEDWWNLHPTGDNVWNSVAPDNIFNKEDDVQKMIGIKFPKFLGIEKIKFEVKNGTTVIDSFTQDMSSYNPNTGSVNITSVNVLELPTTFENRKIEIYSHIPLNDAYDWGLRIGYGILLNWRFWQNNDWFLKQPLDLYITVYDSNGYVWEYSDSFSIIDYDSWVYTSEIKFKQISSGSYLTSVLENEVILVEAYHTLTPDKVWGNEASETPVWGQIAVESFQSNPRHIISTTQNVDGQVNSLVPYTGFNRAEILFPADNIALIRCFFDPSKIDLSRGLSFSSKIWGSVSDSLSLLITNNNEPITGNGDNIIVQ
jgi:hypothetical protein